ncbi:MAG: hypothetical protein K9L85_00850 [Candidatus Peribacteraceae bacterium]|nr:hypothetical protein [Candidatus Peribacteraceae bacterium]
MFTFFQSPANNFDSKQSCPRFALTDEDGTNWLQEAERKRTELSARIEAAQINPKAKDKFRRETALVLDKNNPLERLHDLEESLKSYEEFVLGMRTSFLYERDGFISGKFEDFPLWGGQPTSFENETLPSEVVTERIFWLHEFVEPLYESQSNPAKIQASELTATKNKMTARMDQIKLETEKRKKQIADFLELREKYPRLALRFKKLFSKNVFARSTFEERRNILLRIADQIRADEGVDDFLGVQEKDFSAELQSKLDLAKGLPPSDAWATFKGEEAKLRNPPKQIQKLEIFKTWADKFRRVRSEIEEKISTQLLEISQHLAEKKPAAVLRKDRKFLLGLNPRFKLEAKVKPKPISLELEIHSRMQLKAASEADEPTSSVRENLLQAQRKNEFIRRMFIQIAALTMAFGQTSTANETQKILVQGQDMRARENLELSAEEELKQTAAQKTARKVRGAETPAGVDTLGAAQSTEAIEVHGSQAEIREEEQSKFQTDSWETTRLIGISLWPPHELQEYLQTVKRSDHRLEFTHNYLPISFLYAATLLKQRIAANLGELPGDSAQSKEASRKELFNMIDGAQKADDGIVERIFSYTPKG